MSLDALDARQSATSGRGLELARSARCDEVAWHGGPGEILRTSFARVIPLGGVPVSGFRGRQEMFVIPRCLQTLLYYLAMEAVMTTPPRDQERDEMKIVMPKGGRKNDHLLITKSSRMKEQPSVHS